MRIYGFMDGVGPRHNQRHSEGADAEATFNNVEAWQKAMILSHRGGDIDKRYPDEVARGMPFWRAHVMSGGDSTLLRALAGSSLLTGFTEVDRPDLDNPPKLGKGTQRVFDILRSSEVSAPVLSGISKVSVA